MKPNEVLGAIVIVVGLAIILLKFAVDNGWLKKPKDKLEKKGIDIIGEIFKLLVDIAKTQPIMVIGVILVMLGIFVYFGPTAFPDLFRSSSTPTPTPEITPTP